MADTEPLSIVDCCRIDKDMLIHSSNGKRGPLPCTVLVWDSREDDGNREVIPDPEAADWVDPEHFS